MRKKALLLISSLLIMVTMIIGSLAGTGRNAYAASEDFYIVNGWLIKYTGTDRNVVVPDGVTGIGYSAFNAAPYVESIVLSDTVKEISDLSLAYISFLKSLYISKSVEKIGKNALVSCRDLTTIIVDEDNPFFDSRNNCNAIIETATDTLIAGCTGTKIPDGIKVIADEALLYTGITDVYIPDTVEKIGDGALMGTKPTEIFIPAGVKEIGEAAITPSEKLTKVTVDSKNPYFSSGANSDVLIEKATNRLILATVNATIPEGVEIIGNNAMADNINTQLTIPSSVKEIDYRAFMSSAVETIYIPSGVETIGKGILADCQNLQHIEVDKDNSYYDSRNCDAIFETATNKLVMGCKNTIIPEGTEIIGTFSFDEVRILDIIIPSSVREIEVDAFIWTNAEAYYIPETVQVVDHNTGVYFEHVYAAEGSAAQQALTYDDYVSPYLVVCHPDTEITIVNQPYPCQVEANEEATFFINAVGKDLTYQWQYKKAGSNSWTDWTGKTTARIYVPYDASQDRMELRCILNDSNGNTLISAVTELIYGNEFDMTKSWLQNVISDDEIIRIPEGIRTIDLYAANPNPDSIIILPSTVWELRSCAFGKVDVKAVYVPESVTEIWGYALTKAEEIYVVQGSVTEEYVKKNMPEKLRYYDPECDAIITRQPSDVNAESGHAAIFSVSAAGDNLKYQWQYKLAGAANWKDWSGKTTAKINVPYDAKKNGMTLRCRITDKEGKSVTSQEATLIYVSNLSDFDIEDGVLKKYNGLDSFVAIPNGVKVIGNYAFYQSTVKNVIIPQSVEKIKDNAFDLSNLTEINIPASVKEIGNEICASCYFLEKITVDPANPIYSSENNSNAIIEKATGTLIMGCAKTVIPEGIKKIGYGAFYDVGIENVVIPSSVEIIDHDAFVANKMESINIPASVKQIGSDVFNMCSCLKSITVDPDNTTYDSRNGCNAIIESETDVLFWGCSNTVIPDGIKGIYSRAFSCSEIEQITIPSSVTDIYMNAFQSSSLKSIYIPAGVKYIADDAFSDCSKLETIVVDGANQVYDSRNNCNALIRTADNVLMQASKNTIIPNDIKIIGAYAFGGICLSEVKIPSSVEKIGNMAFRSIGTDAKVYIPESVKEIENYAFDYYGDIYVIKGSYAESFVKEKYPTYLKYYSPEGNISITKHPVNTCVAIGHAAPFAVNATGTGLRYQWQYKFAAGTDFKDWAGKTTAKINVPYDAKKNGMSLRCVITDANGEKKVSDTVILSYAESPVVMVQPVDVTVESGHAAPFMVKASGDATLTYQWQYKLANGTGFKDWAGKTTYLIKVPYDAKKDGMQLQCVVTDGNGKKVTSGVAVMKYVD